VPDLVEQIDVDAPPERVWRLITDWERQGDWMLATDVRTVEDDAQRLHGRLRARTGLRLPGRRRLGVLDTMVITKWDPPRLVEVQHTGRFVRGPGTFEVSPRPGGCTVVCTETWYLPYGYLGVAGWAAVRPLVFWGLRRSLQRLAELAERS
jgi:uncharacterized protein YndB with AHSA1/START domain